MYNKIPDSTDFTTEFPTYILAFCPDSASWYATNQRFFYYEYPMDFPNEEAAIGYFERNPDVFLNLELSMGVTTIYGNGVWLDNINRLVKCREQYEL